MGSADVVDGENPEGSLTFSCPDNCSKLWLVVSGAPQEHWRHEWDDDNTNDEQWPYEVQFVNTNLLGEVTGAEPVVLDRSLKQVRPVVSAGRIRLPENAKWRILNLAGRQVRSGFGNSIDIKALSDGGYILSFQSKRFKVVKSLLRNSVY